MIDYGKSRLKTNEIILYNDNSKGFPLLKVLLLINISLLWYSIYKISDRNN